MKCLKCGAECATTKCAVCGNDIKAALITTIWNLSEEYIKWAEFPYHSIDSSTQVNPATDPDLEKLREIGFSEVNFAQGLYRGQLKNGEKHGFGIQYDRHGKKAYAGEWLNNKKSGYGRIYTRNELCEFEGWFKNGLRHGIGLSIFPDGRSKEFIWHEGSCQGEVPVSVVNPKTTVEISAKKAPEHTCDHAKLRSEDLERLSETQKTQITSAAGKYVGDVKNGMRHGFGIQYDKTGHISYAGMWENNKMHGKGRLYNQQGQCQFDGLFNLGFRDGVGVEFCDDGSIKVSKWLHGARML